MEYSSWWLITAVACNKPIILFYSNSSIILSIVVLRGISENQKKSSFKGTDYEMFPFYLRKGSKTLKPMECWRDAMRALKEKSGAKMAQQLIQAPGGCL